MLNEEKVLRMTKMASYESKGGKKDKAIAGYFKGDYIGMQMILSFLVVTIAFAVAIVAYLCVNFEEVMANIYTMDVAGLGKKIGFAYLAVLVVYLIVTYAIYLVRYVKARKRLNLFLEYLNCLDGEEEEDDI